MKEQCSYHADADIHTNPFELGLDRLVNLESNVNFIGKETQKDKGRWNKKTAGWP